MEPGPAHRASFVRLASETTDHAYQAKHYLVLIEGMAEDGEALPEPSGPGVYVELTAA
ncbi:MAG: hypothetical protein H0X55_03100 [Thermoleophilaceae bacterium]|nr:hypothetical protein [Thermoleophilaceae bacterium]